MPRWSGLWGLPLVLLLVPQIALGQTVEQLLQQGNAAQTAGKYAEAEGIWRTVIRQNPKLVSAYNGLGKALYAQKKLDEAIAAFSTAGLIYQP